MKSRVIVFPQATGCWLREQRADAGLHVDALDGGPYKAGYREHLDLGQLLGGFAQRNGVGNNYLFEARSGDAFNGRTREDGVAGAGVHAGGTICVERVHGLHEGSGGVDDVVDDEARFAVHVADDVHDFGNVDIGAALIDDSEGGSHFLREMAGAFHAASIGGDNDEVGQIQLTEVADEHGTGEHVVDRDVEEALNLRGVEIDKESAIGAGGGKQISNELGADGDAGTVFAILAGVSIVRNDRSNAGRRGAFEGIDHDEQLDEVLIDGITGGLHHENVDSADILEQLEVHFAICETLKLGFTDMNTDVPGNLIGEGTVGRSAEELEAAVLAEIAGAFAFGRGLSVLRLGVAALSRLLLRTVFFAIG